MPANKQISKKKPPPTNGFKKGQSGNPSGRPKTDNEVKDLAATHTRAAIERLAFWMMSADAKSSIQASIALLNRAWGMPTAPVAHSGEVKTVTWPLPKTALDE